MENSASATARPRRVPHLLLLSELLRLCHALRSSVSAALRLLVLAAVFCLASLLSRPAPALATASPAGVATVAAGPATISPPYTSSSPCSISYSRSSTDSGSSSSGGGHPKYLIAADRSRPPFPSGPRTQPAGTSSPRLGIGGGTSATSLERGPAVLAAVSTSLTATATTSPPLGYSPSLLSASSNSGSSSSNYSSCAGGSGVGSSSSLAAEAAVPEVAAVAGPLVPGEAAAVRLFERHRASVVNISGMRAMQTFTTLDLGKIPYGQGSGFLWGAKGHVVTCYHLVKGAAEVKVTLYDNTSYTAKVLGYDAAKNIAVLKLSVPKSKLRELQPVALGSAAGLRVGQAVYGIGNPWGLGHTMSQGLVCGLGAELSAGLFPIKGVILTSGCGADPGSSGGVLLDGKGNLVGMLLTPPASSSGGGGRCFAVPIDAIRGLITQILAYGRTVRPALGITMAPAQVLERVGVEGVLVLEVPPGSPAHAAGLRPTHRDIFGDLVLGDVIVGLDGKAVLSASDVYDILDEHRVGDRVKLDVLRDGKQTGLTVTLGERLLGAVEE